MVQSTAAALSVATSGRRSELNSHAENVYLATKMPSCEVRPCFLKLGLEILDEKTNPDGSLTEIYRIKRETGSTVRSFSHGVLSLGTLAISNVVARPSRA